MRSVHQTSSTWKRCTLRLLLAIGVLSTATPITVAEEAAVNYAAPLSVTGPVRREIPYSDFLQQAKQGKVAAVIISGERIRGELADGSRFTTVSPETNNSGMIETLIQNNVTVTGEARESTTQMMQWLLYALPILLLIALYVHFMRQKQQQGLGGSGAMSFGKSPARVVSPEQVKITLSDVAGVEEAKQEVAELVDFLKDPEKFRRLGGKIPRGVLMVGPPGTGKTLLAKAIAGEAGVPFFTLCGSDFVEMFVGVGASRVRDLFDQAEERAPCIIFIDEIDAVGHHRGAGAGGGHDERDQTLNQLLVRMDGIEGDKGVIVVAATNRPDVLDAALLRPGRFDRQVVVPLPDIRGRECILRVHMRGVPLADDVDPEAIARAAPGFSGADLAGLVNEAALFAARSSKARVEQDDFEKAREKILLGAERRSLVMSEQQKQLTAYHEAGHAIVGLNVPDHDPVCKVSIIPRGRAMGLTLYLPRTDRYSQSREFLNSRICSLFGGRVAEELVFGADGVTTGAANDIERATEIARSMVIRYGMSEKLGPLAYADDNGKAFPGGAGVQITSVSNDTARAIDEEVRQIIERNYARARCILECNLDELHLMAGALMQHETLDTGQIETIMRHGAHGASTSRADQRV